MSSISDDLAQVLDKAETIAIAVTLADLEQAKPGILSHARKPYYQLAMTCRGTALGIATALLGGLIVYGTVNRLVGLRLDAEEEFNGADLSIHKITASAERETSW